MPAVISLLIRGVWIDDRLPAWFGWGFAAVVAVTLGYVWLSWIRFTYAVEEDRLVVRKGVWQREVRTIYRSRIHSVNVEQPLLQRMFGVVRVSVETASGGGIEPEAIFEALSRKEAAVIRRLTERKTAREAEEADVGRAARATSSDAAAGSVGGPGDGISGGMADGRSAGLSGDDGTVAGAAFTGTVPGPSAAEPWSRDPVASAEAGNDAAGGLRAEDRGQPAFAMAVPPETFAAAALTSFNLRLAVAFFAGVLSFVDDLVDSSFYITIARRAAGLLHGPSAVLFVVAVAMLLSWALSVVLYVWKYAGFRLETDGERIHVSYGLLSKRQITFPARKVQAAILEQGWLRKPFGRGELRLAVVQSGLERTALIHPFLPVRDVERMLAATAPHLTPIAPDRFPPRRAWLFFVRWKAVLALALAAGAVAWFGWAAAWSAVPLLPLAVFWGHAQYRSAGVGIRGDHLVLRYRAVAERTVWLRRRNVQSLALKATVFQRRRDLCTVTASVSGGLGGFRFSVSQLSAEAAQDVYEWYSWRRVRRCCP